MRLRWLVVALLGFIVTAPLFAVPKVEERRAMAARMTPVKKREPLPVSPYLPNAYRVNPVPKPAQA